MLEHYIYYYNIFLTKLLAGGAVLYFIKSKIVSIFKALLLITPRVLYITVIFIGSDSLLSSLLLFYRLYSSRFFSNKGEYIHLILFKLFGLSRGSILYKLNYFLIV